MQAIAIESTGQRGRLEELPAPQAGPRDAVVRVTFAGVNPIDGKVRDGHAGELDRRPFILGQDFAGVVESIGDDVREVAVGDRVFGVARGSGSYAQRARVTEGVAESPFARIPDDVSDAVAAAIPTPVLTAYASLELLGVGSGTRLLIAGAAGAVGSAALQIARSRGADVTALVRPQQREAVRELGATRIIDAVEGSEALAREDRYDAVLDVISDGAGLERYWAALRAVERWYRRGTSRMSSGLRLATFERRTLRCRRRLSLHRMAWKRSRGGSSTVPCGYRIPSATWPMRRKCSTIFRPATAAERSCCVCQPTGRGACIWVAPAIMNKSLTVLTIAAAIAMGAGTAVASAQQSPVGQPSPAATMMPMPMPSPSSPSGPMPTPGAIPSPGQLPTPATVPTPMTPPSP